MLAVWSHAESGIWQNERARALGIELEYERFEVAPDDLAESVRAKHQAAIDGYNVTVPHKEAIMTLIDEVAPAARAIGASLRNGAAKRSSRGADARSRANVACAAFFRPALERDKRAARLGELR